MMEALSMNSGFAKFKGRSRLPDPPADDSNNLAAPEIAAPIPGGTDAPLVRQADELPPAVRASTIPASKPRIDGRMRLRKDRTEALSTKIKPRHRELLMALADAYESTLSETLEKAIEALETQARKEGRVLT
jgi:hypothetical protein